MSSSPLNLVVVMEISPIPCKSLYQLFGRIGTENRTSLAVESFKVTIVTNFAFHDVHFAK